MDNLEEKYKLPAEIVEFIKGGFLEVISENEAEKTVQLLIPSLGTVDAPDSFTSYTLIWIHPDHNAEFCHYYLDEPGDLPNFYVEIHSPNGPDDQVDDLDTVNDLVDWLASTKRDMSDN